MQIYLLIFIFAFPLVDGTYIKINFDFHFTCGKYHGAEGRLYVIMTLAEIGNSYIEFLDVVLDRSLNGHFKKSVIIDDAKFKSRKAFEVYFRTDCYILNRIGECCAHEFKFTIPIKARGILKGKSTTQNNWFKNTFNEEFLAVSRCKREQHGRTKYEEGMDCSFDFSTYDQFHPRNLTDQIDLMQLLINTNYYSESRATIVELGEKLTMAFNSRRLCSPRDDKIGEAYQKGWQICDHPNYGLPFGIPSYERDGVKEYQGNDVKHWKNCKCNFPASCPVDCSCEKLEYCPIKLNCNWGCEDCRKTCPAD